jgi:hypothetical protein
MRRQSGQPVFDQREHPIGGGTLNLSLAPGDVMGAMRTVCSLRSCGIDAAGLPLPQRVSHDSCDDDDRVAARSPNRVDRNITPEQ